MKFSCAKKAFAEALQITSKASSSKQQMPILSGIYLKAKENTLELQATDYELGFIINIPAEVEETGQIVLSGRYLQEVVRKLPGESVSFSFHREENIAHLQSEQANFTLLSMNASEFPIIPAVEGVLSFTIEDGNLRELIKKTVFSCAMDETRPVFTGCLMEVDENTITMAATNTHRLSTKKITLEEPIGSIKIIIPAKSLNELLHIMNPEHPSDVQVTCSHNKISFVFDNIYMTSRLIEGSFPDYKHVIPTEFSTEAQIPVMAFSEAVDRVALISRSNEYNIMRLSFNQNQVHISSNNPDIGNADETVPISMEGPEVNIAFNVKYITDVLKSINGEKCLFSLNQSLNPMRIMEEGDDTFLYVVTPVRTAH